MTPAIYAVWAICLASGWCFMEALAPTSRSSPSWIGALRQLALGALAGPGLASLGFFAMILAGITGAASFWTMLLVLLAVSATLLIRRRMPSLRERPFPRPPPVRFPGQWAIAFAAAVGLGLFAWHVWLISQLEPTGGWDARGFWNLRAAYLARGDGLWQLALHVNAGGLPTDAFHPSYPLFLSGFVALQWVLSPGFQPVVPAVTGLIFCLACILLLFASLAERKSIVLGLIAGSVFMSFRSLPESAADQLSDILLAFALLASVVLLDQARSIQVRPAEAQSDGHSRDGWIAAGLVLGLAPWIKNEGWPFLLAAGAVVYWRCGWGAFRWLAAGAAPGLLGTLTVKLLGDGIEYFIPTTIGEVLAKVSDPHRWWQILVGFGHKVIQAGHLWAHPLLLLAVLALVLRLAPLAELRARMWLGTPVLALMLCDFGAYVITQFDLTWHIETSAARFVLQVSPALLWLAFSILRAPEDALAEAASKADIPSRRPVR
jgi:hypothetical protein